MCVLCHLTLNNNNIGLSFINSGVAEIKKNKTGN